MTSVVKAGRSNASQTSRHRSINFSTGPRRRIRRNTSSEPLCKGMCKWGQIRSGWSAIVRISSGETSPASRLEMRMRKSPSNSATRRTSWAR